MSCPANGDPILTESRPLRIASIPAAHPYVRAIADPDLVHVLPDPPVPGAPAEQWWPPVALTAGWLVAHADDFDVLHVHFGLESFAPGELREALEAARRLGRPVVYTVHDLDNPQLVDQSRYRALLDVLVPFADHLVTLTAGAAEEIERRWQRPSQVLTHPTLLEHSPTARRSDDGVVRVGIPLRDLRPNIDAESAVRAASAAAASLIAAGISVEFDVLMSDRVRDDAAAARVLAAAATHPAVRVRQVSLLSDAGIEAWIGSLDLFLLPYTHGTHSGWVELCYDLGVPVAGTDVGYIRQQHPADFAIVDLDGPESLVAAVHRIAAADASRRRGSTIERRRTRRLAERHRIRRAHVGLYTAACAATLAGVEA